MATIKNAKRNSVKTFVDNHPYLSALPFVLLGLALMLSFTGCGKGAASTTDPAAVAAEAETPAEETKPEPPAENTLLKQLGEVITYEDGLSISVSAPVAFAPTEYAAGADQANQVLFTLVVTNNTDKPLDPSFYGSISSGGVEASKIYDMDNPVGDVNFAPTTAILPGQTISWNEAWSIADPASITVDFFVGFGYENAIFTNIPF